MADLALRSRRVLEQQGSHGRAEKTHRLQQGVHRGVSGRGAATARSHPSAHHAALMRARCSSVPGGDQGDISNRRRSALRVSRAIGNVMPVAMSSDVPARASSGPIQTSVAGAIAAGEFREDDWERALEESKTSFVAETLLPTRSGKFRVRAYRHQVRSTSPAKHSSSAHACAYRLRGPALTTVQA